MPALFIRKGPKAGKTIPLNGTRFVLGRNADCGICFPPKEHAVSREHATIRHIQGRYYIEDGNGRDKKSRNHTFVNDLRIDVRTLLKHEDEIRICNNVVVFVDPPPSDEDTAEYLDGEEPSSSVDAVVSDARAHRGWLGSDRVQCAAQVHRRWVGASHRAGRPGLDELRVGDNHHMVCRRCYAIADVDCAVGGTPCLTAADVSGYQIDEAEVIYWDRCPEWVAAASVSSGAVERTRSVRHQLGNTALDPEQTRSRAHRYQKATPRKEKDRRV